MPRNLAAYLQDILDADCAITDVMRGISIEDDRTTRSSDHLLSVNSSLLAQRCAGSANLMQGSLPQFQMRERSLILEIY